MAMKFLNTVQVDTDVLYVDTANDRVGIGTDNPDTALHVAGSSTLATQSTVLKIENTADQGSSQDIHIYNQYDRDIGIKFETLGGTNYIWQDSNSDDALIISTGGNNRANDAALILEQDQDVIVPNGRLGIGATNPGASLEVASTTDDYVAKFSHSTATGYAPGSILLQAGQGDSRGQGLFHYNTEADENWFTGVPYAVQSKKWIVANKYSTTQDVDTAQLTNALLTIDSDTGNVGIGATSPAYKLHVEGSVALDVMPGHQTEGTIRIGRYDNNTSRYNDIQSYVSSTASQNYLRFSIHNGVENSTIDVMSIKGSGYVGIGTISPNAMLDIHKNDDTVYDPSADDGQRGVGATIQLNNNSTVTNTFGQIIYDTDSSGQAVARMVFLDAGTSSSAIAFVTENGNQKGERMRIGSDGAIQFNDYSAGTLVTDASGNITATTTPPGTGVFVPLAGGSSTGQAMTGNLYGPGATFSVSGNNSSNLQVGDGFFRMEMGRSSIQARVVGVSGAASNLNLNPNGGDVIFSGSGNVGIGTTSPGAQLDVQPTASNRKVTKIANDVMSAYFYSTQADAVLAWTCGSYYQAEVVITASQTNGGTYNNIYIRGIWSNNHTSHHWDELERVGFLTGSTFTMSVGQDGATTNSGRLELDFNYISGSFAQLNVRVTDFYGTHSYTIT
jgi:hypothetical protein